MDPLPMAAFQHLQKNSCLSTDFIFLVRWLKIVLSKLDEKSIFGSSETKIVSFTVTEKVINRMNQVLSADSPNMNDLEELFALSLSEFSVSSDRLWTSYITILSQHELAIFIISTAVVILAVFLVLWNFHKATFYIILLIPCVCWNWMKLYKREIATRHARMEQTDVPAACNLKSLDMPQAIAAYFRSFVVNPGDCGKYYEAIMVEAFWDVDPLVAMADTISGFLFVPLEVFSRVLNKCCKELLFGLPWHSQVLAVVLILVILACVFGYRVRLPFFLGAIEPSENAGLFHLINTAGQRLALPAEDGTRAIACEPRSSNVSGTSQNRPDNALSQRLVEEIPAGQVSGAEYQQIESGVTERSSSGVSAGQVIPSKDVSHFFCGAGDSNPSSLTFIKSEDSQQDKKNENCEERIFSASEGSPHEGSNIAEKEQKKSTKMDMPGKNIFKQTQDEYSEVSALDDAKRHIVVTHENVPNEPQLISNSEKSIKWDSHKKRNQRNVEE